MVELNLHGSLAVIQQTRSALLNLNHIGVREADKGEFTKRYGAIRIFCYINYQLDLY